MPENDTRIVVVSPIIALLKSRAIWVMIGTALANVVILAIPGLGQYRDDLVNILTLLALGVIAKLGGEDIAQKLADGKIEAAVIEADAQVAAAKAVPPTTGAERTGQR